MSTPQELMDAAKCFCFAEGTQPAVQSYVASTIEGGEGIHNITEGLVNWWKFDENSGTSAADSADGANGTLQGTATWTPGVINSAAICDGSFMSRVIIGADTGIGSGAFTFTAWVKPNDNPSSMNLFYDSDGDSSAGMFIQLTGNHPEVFIVANTADIDRQSDVEIVQGDWTYVVVTWDATSLLATTIKIYINSVESGYDVSTNGAGVHGAHNGAPRWMGAAGNFGGNDRLIGALDDVRLYNRVLTQDEINMMFLWRGEP